MPIPELKTKSGNTVRIGTGSGTKWQLAKRGREESVRGELVPELVEALSLAIENGFRHIDTAQMYTTHPEVALAIAQSGVAREDLFLTTKFHPGVKEIPNVYESAAVWIDEALRELKVDYLDAVLIHQPFIDPAFSKGATIELVWRDFVEAKKAGKVRYIGVSNFTVDHLQVLYGVANGDAEQFPQINQIEFHPYLQNQSPGIVQFCQKNNILVEAYGALSPLFRIAKNGADVADHPLKPVLPELAAKYGKSDTQILLRYTLQKGILPITTSSKPERQREALAVYDFVLEDGDVALIDERGSEFEFRNILVGFY